MQKNNIFNKFYFCRTFFLIAPCQILQNDAILINYESFFQKKESSEPYCSQFLEINSLMAETLKINFPKQNSHKQIAEFSHNLFILENWKRLSCILFKKKKLRKKVRVKIKFDKLIIFLCFKFFSRKISFLPNGYYDLRITRF